MNKQPDIGRIFHQLTAFIGRAGGPSDARQWPVEWKQRTYKEYPRFPRRTLPSPLTATCDFVEVLERRHSQRSFGGIPLSEKELSTLLYYTAGINHAHIKLSESSYPHRYYPSSGGLYPLEVYVTITDSECISPGIYHYHVLSHSLEQISGETESNEYRNQIFYPEAQKASTFITITGVFERSMKKYGDKGYRYMLLEAGHLGQNIALTASALGIGCCNTSGFEEERVNKILDLEHEDERALYVATVGK